MVLYLKKKATKTHCQTDQLSQTQLNFIQFLEQSRKQVTSTSRYSKAQPTDLIHTPLHSVVNLL